MVAVTAIAMPASERFVATVESEWGSGAAVAPIDHRLQGAELQRVLDVLAPTSLIGPDGERSVLTGGQPAEPGDALVIATSGSTGFPKGVVLTHDAVKASANLTSSRLNIDPAADRWMCCLPVSHVGGLSVITRAIHTGTPLSLLESFDADAVRAAVRTDGVTRISLVTRALSQIDSALFTTVLLGGAAPPADRPENVIATYGSTETGSGIVYEREALDGVELRIDDAGQLWVRSSTLLRCYRDGTDPKDSAGWYPTGDAGQITDGVLSVSGRMGDVIVTGGEKVWPARVEPLIRALASVAEIVVVGRPNDEWGHEVTAVVQPADPDAPPTLDELKVAVRAELPAWWAPRRLELTEGFTRTPLGKIERHRV